LIFKNNSFLKILSNKGLFLFLIKVDLFDILNKKNRPKFYLLFTLIYIEKVITERFLSGLAIDLELIILFKTFFKNGNKLNKTSLILKIKAAKTIIYLYLYNLFYPDAVEKEIYAFLNVFIINKVLRPASRSEVCINRSQGCDTYKQ
ncbi:hypothetical protein CORC01_09928, partial [Colletotrichum orchidophilum]